MTFCGMTSYIQPSPTFLAPGDQPATIERLDDTTVAFRFAVPHALFPMRVASSEGEVLTIWPRHYLADFHQAYNEDATERSEDEGFTTRSELFFAKAERWINPDLPTLAAWR